MRSMCVFIAALFGVLSTFASAQVQGKFKVGISAPFSGVLAEYGSAVRNGITLAQRDKAENLGNIEFILEDSQWEPKAALAAFNTLKDVKNVSLIYNWGNPTSEAVAPVAEKFQVPMLAMSSDPRISQQRQFVIRTLPSAVAIGKKLGQYLIAQGYTRYGMVIAENSYVQGLYEGLSQELISAGLVVEVVESCTLDQQDFKSVITKLRNRKYDALGVFLISGQVSSFFRQAAAMGYSVPTFGADFFGSKTEIAAAGAGIEGGVFPDLGVTAEFRARYLKEFGNDAHIAFAANVYDLISLIAQEFVDTKQGVLSAQEIIERIRNAREITGAHGSMRLSTDVSEGNALATPIVIRKIVKGEIVDQ